MLDLIQKDVSTRPGRIFFCPFSLAQEGEGWLGIPTSFVAHLDRKLNLVKNKPKCAEAKKQRSCESSYDINLRYRPRHNLIGMKEIR
jgi:hypothetical protein